MEEPKNGYWKTKSKGKTIAKNLFRSFLPVGRYVSYRLEPGKDFSLKAGGEKAILTDKDFSMSETLVEAIKTM